MTARCQSGITLAFIISRDFEWGLVLVDDKWKFGGREHRGGDARDR